MRIYWNIHINNSYKDLKKKEKKKDICCYNLPIKMQSLNFKIKSNNLIKKIYVK